MASLNTLERYGSPFLPTANTSVPAPAPTSLFTIDSPPPTTQPLQQTSSFFSALAPPTTTSGKSYLNTVYKNPFTFTVRAAVIDGDLPKLKKILVAHGLPIQSPNPENGWPLLFYAIQYNKNEIVKFLLDSGHESTGISKDFRKNTALHIAADYKNEIAFNMYLNLYPQTAFLVNKDGKSPLIIATLRGLNDLIIKLLEMGADVNSVDGDASTPLHQCAVANNFSLKREQQPAIKALQRAVQVDPDSSYAHTLLGHEYLALEEYDKAMEEYRMALNLDERCRNAWFGLAQLYLKKDHYYVAEQHYKKALLIHPQNTIILMHLGTLYYKDKRYVEALGLFESVDRVGGGGGAKSVARVHMAECLVMLDRFEEAKEILEDLIMTSKPESKVYMILGNIYKKEGEFGKALKMYTMAQDHSDPKSGSKIREIIDRLYIDNTE
ncbi:hypothetical protein HK098_003246, partial [Nowakowskiella sp. JEL0407]